MMNKNVLISSGAFFSEALDQAFEKQKVKIRPEVKSYLTQLLEFFLVADNLYDTCDETGSRSLGTLAELYLTAAQAEKNRKSLLLKKLGDRSLYISGFFAQSFKKKTIDVEYYSKMGQSAYGSLAGLVDDDFSRKVYTDISQRFSIFMDSFSYISQKSLTNGDEDILTLYEQLRADSEYAKQKLAEMGLPVIKYKAN